MKGKNTFHLLQQNVHLNSISYICVIYFSHRITWNTCVKLDINWKRITNLKHLKIHFSFPSTCLYFLQWRVILVVFHNVFEATQIKA